MGKLNVLKAEWIGKVGKTVGAKWKNRSTIRTYSTPADPKTQAQIEVRRGFSWLTKFIALFADQIKYKSALDTSGMSVKNRIIKINKAVIREETIDPTDIIISQGGLQKPNTVAASYATATGKVTVTWVKPIATNFTQNAKMELVYVNDTEQVAFVGETAYDAQTATIDVGSGLTGTGTLYAYYLDKRGSSKVASLSVGVTVTAP